MNCGISSVGLERYVDIVEVTGSNPVFHTIFTLMVLVIDIGNTFCKIAPMDSPHVSKVHSLPHDQLIQYTEKLLKENETDQIAICSVHHSIDSFLEHFDKMTEITVIDQKLKLPFKNLYQSNTLGNDRIALVAGAQKSVKKDQAALVIDAGTCVTYDFLDCNHDYHGGAISPGLEMRFKALHTFTSKLPLVQPTIKPSTTGTTTIKSIQSGVQNGLAMEIDSMIDHYKIQEKDIKIFLTGGDSALLSKQLKNRFFADSYLALIGIYNLYLTN